MLKPLKQDLILPDGVNVSRLLNSKSYLLLCHTPNELNDTVTTTVTSTVITQTIHINFHMYLVH